MCEDFISNGVETTSPERSGYYKYYADVVDSATGKELYADKAVSQKR